MSHHPRCCTMLAYAVAVGATTCTIMAGPACKQSCSGDPGSLSVNISGPIPSDLVVTLINWDGDEVVTYGLDDMGYGVPGCHLAQVSPPADLRCDWFAFNGTFIATSASIVTERIDLFNDNIGSEGCPQRGPDAIVHRDGVLNWKAAP